MNDSFSLLLPLSQGKVYILCCLSTSCIFVSATHLSILLLASNSVPRTRGHSKCTLYEKCSISTEIFRNTAASPRSFASTVNSTMYIFNVNLKPKQFQSHNLFTWWLCNSYTWELNDCVILTLENLMISESKAQLNMSWKCQSFLEI